MTTNSSVNGLLNRLRLIKDIAEKGGHLLSPQSNDADAIHGIVLLDLSLYLALLVAFDIKMLPRKDDHFQTLLAPFQELKTFEIELIAAHRARNAAQHQGIPPNSIQRSNAKLFFLKGIRELFIMCSSDYDTFSSVPQIQSPYLREMLETTLSLATEKPNDAAAYVSRAYNRAFGWASEIIGQATVPEKMNVFGRPLYEDVNWETICMDGTNKMIRISLSVAAGHVFGLNYASIIRLRNIIYGHQFKIVPDQGMLMIHDEDARDATSEEVKWAVEVIARGIIHLEMEWPEYIIVENSE